MISSTSLGGSIGLSLMSRSGLKIKSLRGMPRSRCWRIFGIKCIVTCSSKHQSSETRGLIRSSQESPKYQNQSEERFWASTSKSAVTCTASPFSSGVWCTQTNTISLEKIWPIAWNNRSHFSPSPGIGSNRPKQARPLKNSRNSGETTCLNTIFLRNTSHTLWTASRPSGGRTLSRRTTPRVALKMVQT